MLKTMISNILVLVPLPWSRCVGGMNGPWRRLLLISPHRGGRFSFDRCHSILMRNFHLIPCLLERRAYIRRDKQSCLFSSTIHVPEMISSTNLSINSPILAHEAMKCILDALSTSRKGEIPEYCRRPWEGKCHFRDILKLLGFFSDLSVTQRSLILSQILQQLPHCEQIEDFSILEICQALSGLRYVTSNTALINDLVDTLNKQLVFKVSVCGVNRSDADALGLAISGLRHLSSNNPSVRSLFINLSTFLESALYLEDIETGHRIMSLDIVCRALSGLENCSSENSDVRTIVKLLANQLREPSRTGHSQNGIRKHETNLEVLTGKQILMAATALKGLSSAYPECRAFIGSLSGRLQSMRGKSHLREPLTTPAAVAILSNLGNMESSDVVSLEDFLC